MSVQVSAVLVAAAVACRDGAHRKSPPEEPAVSVKPSNPCDTAVRALAAGELATWNGLPSGCTDRDLAAMFSGGGDPAGDGRLSNMPTKFRDYSAGDANRPIQAWFDGQDTAFLVTWVEPVVAGDVASLLSALGPPEHKLEPGVGYHADAHQWIYASRGMTLWVREHRDEIARVAVYKPTTAADYELRLGGRDKTTYLPRR
jgi:hypothetical protein